MFFKKAVVALIVPILIAAGLMACKDSTGPNNNITGGTDTLGVPYLKPAIIQTFPHDGDAFTQGLLYDGNVLYESTGLYGRSSLRRLDLQTGQILDSLNLNSQYFGEGLALKDSQLVQLTWRSGIAFIYAYPSIAPVDTFRYGGPGWGLTCNSTHFIMSDGSDRIFYRNDQFKITREIEVTLEGRPLSQLNELEYANSKIYANVWMEDYLVEILPQTGQVSRVIDCSELVALEDPGEPGAVLNGIAFNTETGTFYLTGKLWGHVYEVRME